MESTTTKPKIAHSGAGASTQLFEDWFDPIESGVRNQVRHFIEGMIEADSLNLRAIESLQGVFDDAPRTAQPCDPRRVLLHQTW